MFCTFISVTVQDKAKVTVNH